jgi:hypothetical protein
MQEFLDLALWFLMGVGIEVVAVAIFLLFYFAKAILRKAREK